MLKRLKIKNYLKHKKITIEFDPHVTTIIGKSASGKSSIVRALRWVTLDEPKGTSFINWDSDYARSRLDFDNHKLIRKRSKTINTYQLDKNKFVAFKNTVPPPISKALNISDLNFQKQQDALFWFSNTAGEVGRQLNRIVNLDIIDKVLANIASQCKQSTSTIAIVQSRLDNLTQQKKKMGYVKQINTDLKRIEKQQKQHKIICENIAYLRSLKNKGIESRKLKDNAVRLELSGGIAVEKGEIYNDTVKKTDSLSNIIKSAESLQNIVSIKQPSFLPLISLNNEIIQLVKDITTLSMLEQKGAFIKIDIDHQKQTVKKITSQIKKSFGKECPLCGEPRTL